MKSLTFVTSIINIGSKHPDETFESRLDNLKKLNVEQIILEKIKKNENLNLELEKNIDILNYVSKHNSLRPKLVIGFAAETNEIETNAKKKLVEKNCDWVVANDVSNKSIGFDSDFNEVLIFYKDDKIKDEKLSLKQKSAISEEIVDRVIQQLN